MDAPTALRTDPFDAGRGLITGDLFHRMARASATSDETLHSREREAEPPWRGLIPELGRAAKTQDTGASLELLLRGIEPEQNFESLPPIKQIGHARIVVSEVTRLEPIAFDD